MPKQLIMSAVRCTGPLSKQVILTMQASAFLLLACCLQVGAATYSQQTVSFSGKNVPLKTVFASVKKETGYGFFYENGEEATLKGAGNVTLDLKNVSLDLFMRICLKDQPLEYSVEGTTIFIKKKEEHPTQVDGSSGTPVGDIKGRITNDKGEPLVNANVVVKRTQHGTATDANGEFTLHNINSDDVLLVTFIGYKTQVIPVHTHKSLSLIMATTDDDLDKLVVQAYGTTTRRLSTSNIGTLTAEDISKQPVINPLEALQGSVAGLSITQTSGFASAPFSVDIRGRNSINPSIPSDPLYIIDGVPLTILEIGNASSYIASSGVTQNNMFTPAGGQSPFFNINPSDIESIEVLKDADATAIYGSRGANGVILITTKKGKSGKNHFELNAFEGVSQVPHYYKLLNTQQYLSIRRQALSNDGLPININNAPDLVNWDTTRYTDWQKYLWGRTGKTTSIDGSLTGGDARTTFRVGSSYLRSTDVLAISGANQRGSLSFNLNNKSLDNRFSISLTGEYSVTSANMIYLPNFIALSPNAPAVFDSHNELNWAGWGALENSFPFGGLKQPYNSKTNLLNSSLMINYELLRGLMIKTNIGYNNIQVHQINTDPATSQNPLLNPTGNSTFGYNFFHNVIIEPQIEYTTFLSRGKFNVLLGSSNQANVSDGLYMYGYGYTNDALLQTINTAPSKIVTENYGEYKYAAVFSRINYNWENKYIINLNARRDGSSKFGPGRQFGNFGSVGAAYIFTEEKWIKDHLQFISFGKLRGSYGITGNDQIKDYQFQSLWSSPSSNYQGIVPFIPTGHSDSLLHWEVNRKTELSLDISTLKDKISLEATYYSNKCYDQLIQFPTPEFTGFTTVTANSNAKVRNSGWEFTLDTKILDSKTFSWSSKFNLSINRNKLLAYPNLSQSPYAGVYVVGKSLNIRKLLHFTGVDPNTGLYTFQDKNHDGQITVDLSGRTIDDTYVYDLNPSFEGGVINNFRYKNIELSLFLFFRKQKGPNVLASLNNPGSIGNQPTAVLSNWQQPGQTAQYAKLTTSPTDLSYTNFSTNSDALYTDASFIRLKNLSLSYSLDEKILKKAGISGVKVYVKGENLFFITKYKGIDPETKGFGSLPILRIITGGVAFNF